MKNVRLGDVAERINIKVDQATTDLEYYVGGEHIESSEFMLHQRAKIKGSTIGYQFQFGFRDRDILFMTKNPHLRKCTMANFEGLCSIATFVIHTKSEELLQDYLLFEMQSDRFWQYCEDHKSGGVNYFINWGTLSDYEFDLPSLDEQKVLADKLWAAYRVKESYRKLLAATDDMVKAKFVEMFGDSTKSQLGAKINILRGVSYKPSDVCDTEDGATIILRANNISTSGILNFDDLVYVTRSKIKDEQMLRKGDILMCASSGSPEHVGKVAIVDKDYPNVAFGAFCLVIRPTAEITSQYLFCLLHSKQFRNHIETICNGTNILNIKQEYIKEWECPIVSYLEQEAFTKIFTQSEATKASLRQSIESIDRVIKSLINQ